MKKTDILASAIIGLISAVIGIFILDFIELKLPFVGEYPFLLLIILPVGAVAMIFIAQILSKKIAVLFQVAKCFLAGILNTLLDLGMFNLLFFLIFPFLFPSIFENQSHAIFQSSFLIVTVGVAFFALSKTISFSAGAINSYFWNKYWTFKKRETESKAKEFGTLYLVTLIGLVINVGVAILAAEYVGPQFGLSVKIWSNVSIVMAAFVSFVWNFLGYKFIVFKK